jgi:hypothetical protein
MFDMLYLEEPEILYLTYSQDINPQLKGFPPLKPVTRLLGYDKNYTSHSLLHKVHSSSKDRGKILKKSTNCADLFLWSEPNKLTIFPKVASTFYSVFYSVSSDAHENCSTLIDFSPYSSNGVALITANAQIFLYKYAADLYPYCVFSDFGHPAEPRKPSQNSLDENFSENQNFKANSLKKEKKRNSKVSQPIKLLKQEKVCTIKGHGQSDRFLVTTYHSSFSLLRMFFIGYWEDSNELTILNTLDFSNNFLSKMDLSCFRSLAICGLGDELQKFVVFAAQNYQGRRLYSWLLEGGKAEKFRGPVGIGEIGELVKLDWVEERGYVFLNLGNGILMELRVKDFLSKEKEEE